MSDRFYLDPEDSKADGDHVTLGGDEAHHFTRVMRGQIGDVIELFDGSGLSYRCRVETISKNVITLQILKRIPDRIESPLRLTVATALPKGDRQKFLVEKLAELGVARLVPLILDRSVARANAGTVAKMRRHVIEAAKQCGRNVLMEITEEMSLDRFNFLLQEDGGFQEHGRKLLLHPVSLGKVGQVTPKEFLGAGIPAKCAVLVGPEGSFTDREVESALESGFTPMELGARILRTETACVAAASLLLTYAG